MDLDTVFSKLSVSNPYVRIFNVMELMGFDTIHVNYSGGGDSGGPDGCDFFPEPKTPEQKKASDFIWKAFEETLSQPIYDTHGSFADGGGYSVNGTVVWDAKEKSVDINGTHHHYEYDDEGEETSCDDEDWAETVYNLEDDNRTEQDSERSYDCLTAYAMFVLKDKFPGEYHNRMIAGGIEGDEDAKLYTKWCEEGCKEVRVSNSWQGDEITW